jgi:drug/metabolite transporter (DMT)-like permease
MYPPSHSRGALLIVAAAFMFASMGAVVKLVAPQLNNEMVVFFRSLFGLLALLPWLLRGGLGGLRTRQLRLHLGRSLAGLAAMYCFFYALAHLQLGEAVLLNYTAPLFTPLIAWLWLREAAPVRLYGAIAIGFAGIALILKPGLHQLQAAAWIGLASGALAALAFVGIRRMANSEPTTRIVFYYSLVSTVVSALPLAWSWQRPDARAWSLLLAIGVLATTGQLLLTRAYALAPVVRIGPFTYSAVVFAAAYGWLLWAEAPDWLTLAGTLLVCLAGVLALRLRETPGRAPS